MFFSYEDIFKLNEKIAMSHSIWYPNKLEAHCHDFFEIAYILKGDGFHILNGNKHAITRGNLFLLTPNGEHNFIPDKNGVLEWENCMFLPDVIDKQLIGITNTADILRGLIFSNSFLYDTSNLSNIELLSNIEDLDKIFHEMENEYNGQLPGYQETLKSYLQILLIKIFRAYFIQVQSNETNSKELLITNIVIEHLKNNNLKKEIDVYELAKQAFYTPKYFRKIFKQSTGISLSNFIRNKKLDYACELLTTTDLPINAIMNEIGINDAKTFYQIFKNYKNLTPNQYRDKYRTI